jgi:hypothetical protein
VTCRSKRTCRGTLTLRRGRTVVAKRAVRVRSRRTKRLRLSLTPQATTSLAGRSPRRLKGSLRGARVTVR